MYLYRHREDAQDGKPFYYFYILQKLFHAKCEFQQSAESVNSFSASQMVANLCISHQSFYFSKRVRHKVLTIKLDSYFSSETTSFDFNFDQVRISIPEVQQIFWITHTHRQKSLIRLDWNLCWIVPSPLQSNSKNFILFCSRRGSRARWLLEPTPPVVLVLLTVLKGEKTQSIDCSIGRLEMTNLLT